MKPTEEEIRKTVEQFSRVIPHFPSEPLVHAALIDEMVGFIGTHEQFLWFRSQCIRRLARFTSVPEFRALFCSEFPPADGISATVSAPVGFRSEDREAQFFAREQEHNTKRLEGYRRAALRDPENRVDPSRLLPDMKRIQ